MGRIASILLISAACAAAVGTLAVATTSPSARSRAHVLRYQVETAPGRDYVLSGGKRVGVVLDVSRKADRRGGYVSTGAIVFTARPNRGRVFFASAQLNSYDVSPAIAVVGGTGRFAGAHGTGTLDYAGAVNKLTLRLR